MLQRQHTQKRWFTVYVDANQRTTQELVRRLCKEHTLIRRSDGRCRFQTFDLLIAPKSFYELQETLHKNITIAYHQKESKL
ncbi:MAG: hypothetical protein RLZZ76_145 [Candidatus Parcubacteria bacterium]|jgi:hypothetical protein